MNLTIIIPVHKFDENVSNLLKLSISSVFKQNNAFESELLIVVSNSIEKKINKFLKENFADKKIKVIKNDGNTNFQSQINLGVSHVKTDYFSILEYDDELSDNYIKNLIKYFNKSIDVYLTMIIEVNDDNKALKITNEPVWSKQFIGANATLGYLNMHCLEQYTDFKICGAVFKTQEFVNVGMLKTNIELTFQLEMLMRMINSGFKIFVIPKINYKHLATRQDSLFAVYSKTMNLQERKFWFDVAKKEYFFIKDREINKSILEKKDEILIKKE